MPAGRSEIPAELERSVLLEAGHRCAIPTCQFPDTEIAHIVPYAQVKEHRFENLIALCPNCHRRYDRREIDRLSMQAYKRNLPVVGSRYNELERRMIAELGAAVRSGVPDPVILVPGGSAFLFALAIHDGLLEYPRLPGARTLMPFVGADGNQISVEAVGACRLTPGGKVFADRWLTGKELPRPQSP
jgi:hypothetical protein